MRINPNGIQTPRPTTRDFEFEGLEDGEEVAEDVLVEIVTVDVFVVKSAVEDVGEEVDVGAEVRSCPWSAHQTLGDSAVSSTLWRNALRYSN
jgi:hypothetical protein